MDLSRVVTARPQATRWQAVCDFVPSVKESEIAARLAAEAASAGKKAVANIVARVGAAAVGRGAAGARRRAGRSPRRPSCRAANARRWSTALKATAIPITGSLGFKKAEVTAGGVALDEVDSRTMQSKLAPNLYVAGEILDLDGPIGGYNFQAAFSTGWLAGEKRVAACDRVARRRRELRSAPG